MKLFLFLFIFPLMSVASSPDEQELLRACQRRDEGGCEKLGAFYLSKENWENAQVVGEALCKQDKVIGCTYAGTALLSQKKATEGLKYLNEACDKFEPFACRSLGRFARKENGNLSHLYFRRACQYGLDEICHDLSKKKQIFTKMAEGFLKRLKSDCADTTTTLCQDRLREVNACPAPMTKGDCQLIPGYLSIWFRTKMMQLQAKLALSELLAEQKKQPKFSNNIEIGLKNFKAESHRYIIGIKKFCVEGGKATTAEIYPDAYKEFNPRFLKAASVFFSEGKKDDCYSSGLGFEAFAVGNLDAVNPTRLDIWKINHDGNLILIKDGLP